jgi:hypothetical protein
MEYPLPEIKEYLKFYFGVIGTVHVKGGHGVDLEDEIVYDGKKCKLTSKIYDLVLKNKVTFIPDLRPWSDIKESEAVQITIALGSFPVHLTERMTTYRNHFNQIVVSWGASHWEKYCPLLTLNNSFTPEQIRIATSYGIDVFHLIEANMANAATISEQIKEAV